MNRFEFAAPATVDEAQHLLGKTFEDSEILAGGTDLLSLLKDFVVEPKRLVSLSGIAELRSIKAEGNKLTIGAMATLDDLLASAEIGKRFPALAQAAAGIKSPQLRAMGSVAGELLQRPRCWYFRRGLGLLATADGKSLPEQGDNRDHAIFDNAGPAKFVHPSSLAPALIALGAKAEVFGLAGKKRSIAIAELYRTPKAPTQREHVLEPGEILLSIQIDGAAPSSATYEVRQRRGLDWPEVGASVALELDGAAVKKATACLGHVAPTPWPVQLDLAGKEANEANAAAAAAAATGGAKALSGNGHKIELAKVALKRAILRAAGKSV